VYSFDTRVVASKALDMLCDQKVLPEAAIAAGVIRKKSGMVSVIFAEMVINDKQEISIAEDKKDNFCQLMTWPEYEVMLKQGKHVFPDGTIARLNKESLSRFDQIKVIADQNKIPIIITLQGPNGKGDTIVISSPYLDELP
jgi:hypothetical protein